MGSEVPFPFELVGSRLEVPGRVGGRDARGRAARALGRCRRGSSSNAGLPGCHRGYITDLARGWLAALTPQARAETQLFACGPAPMLAAVAKLARDFDVPCQIALEEFMACGIGGCAGCNVLVHTADGTAMKRVCVDGPVFDSREIYPA